LAIDFINNLDQSWENKTLADKRLVINLAFQDKISYHRENGFGTVESALPLKVFTLSRGDNSLLVEMPGIEPGSKDASNKHLQS
jgi:hypothetical protein